jgi:hypothetical protein
MEITQKTIKRFFAKVKLGAVFECWEWLASRDRNGYGKFSLNKKDIKAHRFAYLLYYDVLPTTSVIMHRCDNPACVNPFHLLQGTVKANNQDCFRKGRWKRKCHWNKYSDNLLKEIYTAYQISRNYSEVGRKFNLDRRIIWQLIKRRKIIEL